MEIAKNAGARVVQRQFDNWSSHQNWAVENIDFKYPWVYYSDADERVPEDLAQEMMGLAADGRRAETAYRVRFKNMFMGKWIRHASCYPTWVLRFFRPERVRWERLVNPFAVVDGPEGRLQSHFEHYSFAKGMSPWFAKHNLYSSDEARELMVSADRDVDWPGVFSSNSPRRRKALKHLLYKCPGRPLLVFAYLYFLRMGFLDGRAGLRYCNLRLIYEYMIDLKVKELRRRF